MLGSIVGKITKAFTVEAADLCPIVNEQHCTIMKGLVVHISIDGTDNFADEFYSHLENVSILGSSGNES